MFDGLKSRIAVKFMFSGVNSFSILEIILWMRPCFLIIIWQYEESWILGQQANYSTGTGPEVQFSQLFQAHCLNF